MGKIIKYEFRSMFRLFIPLWLGILALSLVNRFTLNLQFDGNSLTGFFSGLVMFLYVMGIMAVLVVAFIFVILRFYKGVLKEEGYLTMTLPVSLDSVLWGKAIAGWLLMVLTILVCIASVCILVLGNFVQRIMLQLTWNRMVELTGSAAPLALIVVQLVLAALVSTLYNILFLYLAMAIGHLAQKHRVGMSVLAYVVMSTVLSTAYNTFLTPVVNTRSSVMTLRAAPTPRSWPRSPTACGSTWPWFWPPARILFPHALYPAKEAQSRINNTAQRCAISAALGGIFVGTDAHIGPPASGSEAVRRPYTAPSMP